MMQTVIYPRLVDRKRGYYRQVFQTEAEARERVDVALHGFVCDNAGELLYVEAWEGRVILSDSPETGWSFDMGETYEVQVADPAARHARQVAALAKTAEYVALD